MFEDEREEALANCDYAIATALRVELHGLENPSASQLHDFEIASARAAERRGEDKYDDRPSNPGEYISTVCANAVAAGAIQERGPETFAEMAARLEEEQANATAAVEAARIKVLVDQELASRGWFRR